MPVRTCVGCRLATDKKNLIRIVMTLDGAKVDMTGKAPGRGVYLCASQECLAIALNKNAIARGLRIKQLEVSGLSLDWDRFCKTKH